MATHREKSFIATVSSESGTLGHFRQLHAESLVDPFTRDAWTFTPSFAPHFLGHISEERPVQPLQWYFRSTDAGYVIYTRSEHFFGSYIGYGDGYFGAFSTKAENRSRFRFEPVVGEEGRRGVVIGEGDEVITRLVSLDTGKPLCLREGHFKYRVRKSWQSKRCSYIAADGGQPLHLRLKIVQTHAPYLDNPDEV
ncbi:hypothetical protein [Pseudomonas fluorescens]|uniref:hypothetical protein n=1 Tax=Pseudomonas fluorescens TaxID=294 RepID=UPI001784E635|nr:hypothetical protein [Pseudomonas fluorescens]